MERAGGTGRSSPRRRGGDSTTSTGARATAETTTPGGGETDGATGDEGIGDGTDTGTGGNTTPTASETGSDSASGTAGGAPLFQYDLANSGTAPDETGPTAAVTDRWQHISGGGKILSSPAVVDGTVYLGNETGGVSALAAADGSEQWVTREFGRVTCSPAVVCGRVYVGSWDGTVYALVES